MQPCSFEIDNSAAKLRVARMPKALDTRVRQLENHDSATERFFRNYNAARHVLHKHIRQSFKNTSEHKVLDTVATGKHKILELATRRPHPAPKCNPRVVIPVIIL